MKPVVYTDRHGFRRRVLIRDQDDPDEMAEYGVPAGPPDLNEIDWDELKRGVHNALTDMGAIDWISLQKSQALNTVASIVKRYIADLYRRSEKNTESE